MFTRIRMILVFLLVMMLGALGGSALTANADAPPEPIAGAESDPITPDRDIPDATDEEAPPQTIRCSITDGCEFEIVFETDGGEEVKRLVLALVDAEDATRTPAVIADPATADPATVDPPVSGIWAGRPRER